MGNPTVPPLHSTIWKGIVKLSEFDQKLGHTRIRNTLIFQHSCYRPEVENQPNLT